MELTENNLCGKIFNRWEVLKFSHKVGYAKYFTCRCLDCNKTYNVYVSNIIRGLSKSCGCKSKRKVAYNINKKYNNYEIHNHTVRIFMNNDKSKIALCDIEDWERVKQYYWREHNGYAIATCNYKTIQLHRLVMNVNDSKMQIDHINRNKADNRKINLRVCNNQQNSFNKEKYINNTSGYKGVTFDKERNKWRGCIMFNGKHYSSPKRYDTPQEAYKWYIEQSNKLFKEFSIYYSGDKK